MEEPVPTSPPPPRRRPFRGIRFRSSVPTLHDDGSPIDESWSLHCLSCGYELTGLTARICPECGKPFEPYEVWRANRDRAIASKIRTPAYIPYAVLAVAVLASMWEIRQHPKIVLPLAVLPMYETLALYFRKDAADARGLVMILCAVACVTWWSMC